jgi:hypothetical protein
VTNSNRHVRTRTHCGLAGCVKEDAASVML